MMTDTPADELFHVRASIKSLEAREKELRDAILASREIRVGAEHHAIVSDRARSTTDWQALARSLGATPEQIAAHTKSSVYQIVELAKLPGIEELIRLLTGPVIVLDTETTGLSPAAGDKLVSIGALPLGRQGRPGEVVPLPHGHQVMACRVVGNPFYCELNPGRPSGEIAARVQGLSDEYLATKRPFADVAGELVEFLGDAIIVGHNIPFDMGFINAELEACGRKRLTNTVVDTRIISKLLWPSEGGSQDPMMERLGVDRGDRDAGHHALADCMLLARCLPGLVSRLQELRKRDRAEADDHYFEHYALGGAL